MAAAPAAAVLEGYSGRKPKAALPPIILSNVPGTWAYDTMSRRIRDDILARIYAGGWGGGWAEGIDLVRPAGVQPRSTH